MQKMPKNRQKMPKNHKKRRILSIFGRLGVKLDQWRLFL